MSALYALMARGMAMSVLLSRFYGWAVAAILLVGLGVYVAGYYSGRIGAEQEHKAEMAHVMRKAEEKRREIQAAADRASAEYEKIRQGQAEKIRELRGKLSNEVEKTIYADCVLPASGLHLYREAAGIGSGGSSR